MKEQKRVSQSLLVFIVKSCISIGGKHNATKIAWRTVAEWQIQTSPFAQKLLGCAHVLRTAQDLYKPVWRSAQTAAALSPGNELVRTLGPGYTYLWCAGPADSRTRGTRRLLANTFLGLL